MPRIVSATLTDFQPRPGPDRRWLMLEIADVDGRTGLAEATFGARHEQIGAALADALARLAHQNLAPDAVADSLGLTRAALREDRLAAAVVSALENALADLDARAARMSLAATLGTPCRTRVPLYANINRSLRDDRTPAAFAHHAAAAVAEGFTTLKCAPFDEVQPGPDPTAIISAAVPGFARLRAVRDAIGPNVTLLVDCHSRFSEESALRIAAELRALDAGWFEEPLDPLHDSAALARVGAAAGLRMAGAEMGYGVEAFADAAGQARLDVVMPDMKYCGGVGEAVRIAAGMAERGVSFSPHSPAGPVAHLAGAHVCAVVPDALPLEFAWGEAAWRADVLDPPERIEQGALLLPEGPGLGARLNPAAIATHGRAWRILPA